MDRDKIIHDLAVAMAVKEVDLDEKGAEFEAVSHYYYHLAKLKDLNLLEIEEHTKERMN